MPTVRGLEVTPSDFFVRTEEYPLSRRLLLHTGAQLGADSESQHLVAFALGADGQEVVASKGFVDLLPRLSAPDYSAARACDVRARSAKLPSLATLSAAHLAPKSFFLGGVDLDNIQLARVDERDAIATYPALIEQVRARCGAEVARLFAEPVRSTNRATGMANVSWYCELEGTPFPFDRLEPAGREPVLRILRQRLNAFSTLLADPGSGPVLASWLHVLSPDAIMAVAGEPVIKNWGMLPAAVAASPEARDAHFHNGIGLYLASLPTPPFEELEGQSFTGRMTLVAGRESARAAPPPMPPPPPVEAAPAPLASPLAPGPAGRPWLAPAIACGVAALVLAILVFGHVLRYPRAAPGPDADAIAAQRQTNEALRQRLEALRHAPRGACRADAAPAGPGQPQNQPLLLPPSPERTRIETRDPATARPESGTLGTVLENATVLVIAGHSLGSGFFISDRTIVTNHHVVGDGQDVKVASKALGGLVSAKVVAVGTGATRGTQDIAVLEIVPKPGTAFLSIGVAPARLDPVTAAGFPGAVLETIQQDSSLPEANFTQGIVTSHQAQQPDGIETLIHTAQIGHGNSGGPLVDAGGCAVGINSWLAVDEMDHLIFSTYFQALDASVLRDFLKAHGIQFTPSDTPCRPVAAPPPGTPAASPSPQPTRTP